MVKFKCKFCQKIFKDVPSFVHHLESDHIDMIPKGMCAGEFYYYLKTGKTHGNCVECKGKTTWNDKTYKYKRFCNNPKCKEAYTKRFEQRMIGKYGKPRIMDEPEHQKKMLAHRSISGEYMWSNNKYHNYTGSYEKEFLEFLDLVMDFPYDDVITPSPHTYYYMYEGEKHFYIPDVYIPSLNLEIEIKDGGDNPNMHHKIQAVDKVKEKLKDDVMTSNKNINYIKIVNKEHKKFFKYLELAKMQFALGVTKPIYMI